MRIVKLQAENGNPWWVLVHELTIAESRYKMIRPINALTLLAQTIVTQNKEHMFKLCMTLENKLEGVILHSAMLQSKIKKLVSTKYNDEYLERYDNHQKLIFELEAYLNVIYGSLEVSALINRIINENLPMGFKKQSKKYKLFSLDKSPWLKEFYDIRHELSHFTSPVPIISEGSILIEFIRKRELLHFKRGIHSIHLSKILSYSNNLFKLLDSWAEIELKKVDPEAEIDTISQPERNKPVIVKKIRAKEILSGLRL